MFPSPAFLLRTPLVYRSQQETNTISQVVQWFWFGKAADQTYESCIDFTTGAAKAANVVDPAIEPVVPLSKRSAKFSRE